MSEPFSCLLSVLGQGYSPILQMKKVSCKDVVSHPACVTCAGICVDQHVLNLTSKWVFYIYKSISGLLEMSSAVRVLA